MNLINLDKLDTTNEYGGTVFLAHDNFGAFKLKPGESIIPAAHKHPEVLYIIKGEVTFIATEDKEELIAKETNIVTLPADQVKTIINNGEEEVTAFWVNAVSL